MDKSNVYYMERERLLLAQLISEEKIIECKKTGAADLRDKVDAWERKNVTKVLIMFSAIFCASSAKKVASPP